MSSGLRIYNTDFGHVAPWCSHFGRVAPIFRSLGRAKGHVYGREA
jgi:hypothetical protein